MKASELDFRFPLCSKMPVISKVLYNGNKGNLSIPLKQNSAVLLLVGESKENRRFRAGRRESNRSTKLEERYMVLLQVRAIGWRGVWHWNDCTVCAFCAWVCFDQCLCFIQAWCFVEILLTQESSSTRLLSMSEAQALTADKPIRGPFDSRPGVMHLSPLPSQSRSEVVQRLIFSWFIKHLWWAVHRPCLQRSSLLCVSLSSFLSTFLISLCVA